MTPIRERLRDATRPEHDRLEAGLGLMDASLTRAAYRDILARFYGFRAGWEPRAGALLEDEAFFGPRRRLPLLHADLLALGLTEGAIATLPACPPPALEDAAAALGSLYVMEGSTLGGRVIARHLAARLGIGAGDGVAYFTGAGADTGRLWAGFLSRLEAAPERDVPAILDGARATFVRLEAWLLGERPRPGPQPRGGAADISSGPITVPTP
ncbi:biliverdin-producing heme oxygenase [Muricoccus radiodurans]|uniref:biliverdin-producing heme oxygenase n=1 Tax=Muricoccus radiodurans TaxID=2231721 RepID=UPI003CEBB68F